MNEEYTDRSYEDILIEAFFLDGERQLDQFIKDLEKRLILSGLSRVQGNQKEAASILGIKYTTLNMKIKRYGIFFRKEVQPGMMMVKSIV